MKPTLLVAALLSMASPLLQAGFFLKIDGIKGESIDAVHRDSIEVLSWSWGASNASTSTAGGGGAGAGKVSMQDFHFTCKLDKSSPWLALAVADGKHIPTADLHLRAPHAPGTQAPPDFYKVTFKDLIVTSYSMSGSSSSSSDSSAEHSFKVSFSQITFTHTAADGTVTSTGWDLATGTRL
jgi:type VI secretion system secreted protein Hcp